MTGKAELIGGPLDGEFADNRGETLQVSGCTHLTDGNLRIDQYLYKMGSCGKWIYNGEVKKGDD